MIAVPSSGSGYSLTINNTTQLLEDKETVGKPDK